MLLLHPAARVLATRMHNTACMPALFYFPHPVASRAARPHPTHSLSWEHMTVGPLSIPANPALMPGALDTLFISVSRCSPVIPCYVTPCRPPTGAWPCWSLFSRWSRALCRLSRTVQTPKWCVLLSESSCSICWRVGCDGVGVGLGLLAALEAGWRLVFRSFSGANHGVDA